MSSWGQAGKFLRLLDTSSAVLAIAVCLLAWTNAEQSCAGTAAVELQIRDLLPNGFPLLIAHVEVRDSGGRWIPGLAKPNFEIFEDDKKISDFDCRPVSAESKAVAIALVLDVSHSMRGAKLTCAKKAVRQFLARLSPNDVCVLISFARRVKSRVHVRRDFQQAERFLQNLHARGKTALYDAINAAIDELSRHPGLRRAVVVITDGGDNASSTPPRRIVERAAAGGIAVHAIVLGSLPVSSALRAICDGTGGTIHRKAGAGEVAAIMRRVARGVHTGYMLTFFSPKPTAPPFWRRVQIKVKTTDGSASASRGYLPPKGLADWASSSEVPIALLAVIFALLAFDFALLVMLLRRSARKAGAG